MRRVRRGDPEELRVARRREVDGRGPGLTRLVGGREHHIQAGVDDRPRDLSSILFAHDGWSSLKLGRSRLLLIGRRAGGGALAIQGSFTFVAGEGCGALELLSRLLQAVELGQQVAAYR